MKSSQWINQVTITTHALLFSVVTEAKRADTNAGFWLVRCVYLLQHCYNYCQWFRPHNHQLHNLDVFPASLKGVARIKWLTCLPPFFGLCWAPLLCPAPLQAPLAPLVPSGALGPVAHSQPCSHLKGEARQFDWGKVDFYFFIMNTLTLARKG